MERASGDAYLRLENHVQTEAAELRRATSEGGADIAQSRRSQCSPRVKTKWTPNLRGSSISNGLEPTHIHVHLPIDVSDAPVKAPGPI